MKHKDHKSFQQSIFFEIITLVSSSHLFCCILPKFSIVFSYLGISVAFFHDYQGMFLILGGIALIFPTYTHVKSLTKHSTCCHSRIHKIEKFIYIISLAAYIFGVWHFISHHSHHHH